MQKTCFDYNSSCHGACPLVPWKTTYDNNQQKTWCPVTQNVNYNPLSMFTGGNDPVLSKELRIGPGGNVIEPFSYLADYRGADQLSQNFMGPICMSGDCTKVLCPRRDDPTVNPLSYKINYPGFTGPQPCAHRSMVTEDYKFLPRAQKRCQ